MAKVLVNELFNVPEFESQEQKINKIFDRLEARVNKMNAMGGEALNNSSFAGNIENIKKMQAEFEKLTKDLQTYTVEAKKSSADLNASRKLEIAGSKEAIAVQKEVERQAKVNAKINAELTNSYKQLELSAKATTDRYKNLAASLGELHPLTVEAQKDAANLNTQLKRIDAGAALYQRSVGNYSSATAGLNNNIRILASELPNAGISIRTFAMSLSNNIGPFIQSISEVNKQNKILQAEGKATTSVAKTLGASLLSASVITGVAVVAGLKLIEMWQKGSKAAQEAEKAVKKYNDAINTADESERSSAQQQIARLNVLTTLARDNAQSTRARTLAVEELQKTYPSTFGNLTKQAILEGNLGLAVNQTTQALLNRAAAQAAEKKFAAASENVYDLELIQQKAQKDIIFAEQRLKQYEKLNKDQAVRYAIQEATALKLRAQDTITDTTKKLNEARLAQSQFLADAKKNAALAGDVLFGSTKTKAESTKPKPEKADQFKDEKQAIETQKKIAQSEQYTYEQRLDAANNFYLLRMALLKKQKNAEVAAIEEVYVDSKNINAQIEHDRSEAIKKKEKEELESLDKISKAKYATIQQGLNDVELAAKAEGLSAEEVYQKKMDYLVMHMNDLGLNAEEQKKIIEAAQNYELKVIEETQKAKDKADAHELASKKRLYSDLKKLGQETFQFINTLISASIDRQISELEKQGESNDEYYASKRDAIERSSMLEKDKIEATMVLADQEKAEKLKIQQDIAAAKQKQARIDKAIALGTIAINTATAISKAVAEFPITGGLPFSAIAAAIGLAQAAVVLATPIPEYKEGTADHPGGKAILGDGKEPELILEPNRKPYWSADTDTLYNLPKHTMVIPESKLKAFNSRSMDGTVNKMSYDELIRANAAQLEAQTKKIVQALKETSAVPDMPAIISYSLNMERARA